MELNCSDFRGVILHCATNDFAEGAPPELIVERTAAIINFMQQSHRNVKLAIGIILPRPVDTDDPEGGIAKEERRVMTNQLMKRMCKQKRVLYANFQNAALTNEIVEREDWYAKDRLHLNKKGIVALGEYYQGVANTLMDPNQM
jgi:lysophospholipase L1-like esterase